MQFDKITSIMSSGLYYVFILSVRCKSTKTGGVGFERSEHYGGREGLKEVHYGKCRILHFWSLAHIRDQKAAYLFLCCIDFDVSFSYFMGLK